jgi:hypothetical protein
MVGLTGVLLALVANTLRRAATRMIIATVMLVCKCILAEMTPIIL